MSTEGNEVLDFPKGFIQKWELVEIALDLLKDELNKSDKVKLPNMIRASNNYIRKQVDILNDTRTNIKFCLQTIKAMDNNFLEQHKNQDQDKCETIYLMEHIKIIQDEQQLCKKRRVLA
jgi:hypothetical protein